ncbi:uncharacterized protein ACIB01_007696 [Guaruba guarouba]
MRVTHSASQVACPDASRMVLVPIVVLWALAAADQPPVTVTASIGDDACLPCRTQPWGHLRGVTLSCTHHNGTHHPIPILRHRLGWLPPEPGWIPPEEPDNRFRGRVSFCAGGAGGAGLALLLRNLSNPDFGNYSCYVAGAAPPQLLCSLVLQPTEAEVPRGAGLDMIMVVCVLVAAFTAVAVGVVMCCRCGCCGRRGGRRRSSTGGYG